MKPDELMPIMVDKTTGKKSRVEVVMNPFFNESGLRKKNLGKLYLIAGSLER